MYALRLCYLIVGSIFHYKRVYICKESYLPVLECKKENIGYFKSSFLDLGIKTEHKKYNNQFYEKGVVK